MLLLGLKAVQLATLFATDSLVTHWRLFPYDLEDAHVNTALAPNQDFHLLTPKVNKAMCEKVSLYKAKKTCNL